VVAPSAQAGGRVTLRATFARVRTQILRALLLRAVLLGAVAGLAAVAALLLVDVAVGLPMAVRHALRALPWIAGGATLLLLARRAVAAVHAAHDEALALWFERRVPALQYALVTRATGTLRDDAPGATALDAQIASAPLEDTLRHATRAALRAPAIAVAVGVALLLVLPQGAVARIAAPRSGDALDRPAAIAAAEEDPLATIVAEILPPAYTGLPASTVEDPAALQAIVGSRIRLRGRGRDVRAALGADPARDAAADARGWSLTLPMPPRAMPVRLQARARERVLLLDPITDSVPQLTLDAPARDTVMRVATGTLALGASLRDDHGLADAAFELIISSGDGELYEFRTLRLGARRFDAGTRGATLGATLALDSLKLAPGDLIHLRAVAADRNDVTGPGRGASETRTLRVARADEYDSVAVDPAPPSEPEKDALSQRMILQQTRELVARAPRIGREPTQRESRRIAVDQTKLRQRVGRVVFERLGENEGEHQHFPGDGHAHGEERPLNPDDILAQAERAANADPTRSLDNHGDETPVVAINRPLLEAYNHMWRAASELELGEPAAAIPWMERAIAALQAARAAERIYLRGRPPAVVVDLARVRLAGKDEGAPTPRRPRPPADPARAERLARFDRVLDVVAADPAAAADSLLLLRVALPEDARAAQRALDAAANALRQGGDVTLVLANARRALVAEPPRRSALGAWGW
jgi:hypothetical protein